VCFYLFINSENYEQDLRDFTKLSVEDAADNEIPLMFISFPSAKDPAWQDKYPGKINTLIR